MNQKLGRKVFPSNDVKVERCLIQQRVPTRRHRDEEISFALRAWALIYLYITSSDVSERTESPTFLSNLCKVVKSIVVTIWTVIMKEARVDLGVTYMVCADLCKRVLMNLTSIEKF